MDLSFIFNMACSSCNTEFNHQEYINIHECFCLLCDRCTKDKDRCDNCDKPLHDQHFTRVNNIQKCHYYFDCSSFSIGICSCVEKSLCEKHINHVHRNIKKKPCNPKYHDINGNKLMCTQCSFMVACFINQVNNERICIDCAADAQNVIPMESNLDDGDLYLMVSNAAKNIESYLETMDSELENLTTRYIVDKANIEKNILSFVSYYQESLSRNEESLKLMEQKLKDAKLMLQRFNSHKHMITRIMNILCDKAAISKDNIIQQLLSNWKDKILVNERDLKIEFRGDFIQIDGSLEYLKNPETNVTINIEPPNYDDISLKSIDHGSHESINETQVAEKSPSRLNIHQDNSFISVNSSIMTDFHTSTPNKRMRQEDSTNLGAKSIPQFQLASQLELNHEPCDHSIDSNYHELKITHVRDPFWLYIERPEMKEKRKAILESLKNLQNDELMNAVSIRQNDIVIVKDHPSFKEPIKRAQVSFYNLAKKKWKLKLIDFGNSIEVDAKQIYTAKQDLSSIDMTVFRAKLIGLKPKSGSFFMNHLKNNAMYFIKMSLIPRDEIVMVRRIIRDGDSFFCSIKSSMENEIIDWTNELIKANHAMIYNDVDGLPLAFTESNSYCYLYHFYGNCNGFCGHWHKCSWCTEMHSLKNCKAYKDYEKNANAVQLNEP